MRFAVLVKTFDRRFETPLLYGFSEVEPEPNTIPTELVSDDAFGLVATIIPLDNSVISAFGAACVAMDLFKI